jgi:hypothetical protein
LGGKQTASTHFSMPKTNPQKIPPLSNCRRLPIHTLRTTSLSVFQFISFGTGTCRDIPVTRRVTASTLQTTIPRTISLCPCTTSNSNNMGRLIPLVLQPPSDIRRSIISLTSTLTAATVPLSVPDKSPKRNRLIPITELMILPYTKEEWTKVMEEVKYLFLRRQYNQCSAQCIQILDDIKDPVSNNLPPYRQAS